MNHDPKEPTRQFKGVWICAALWFDKSLSHAEKFLIAEVDSLSGDGEPCFAGNKFLAAHLQTSEAHMRDMLAELTSRGYLLRLGFNGRKTWRCVRPDLSSNPLGTKELIRNFKVSSYRKNPTPRENPIPGVANPRQQNSEKSDTEIPKQENTSKKTTTTTVVVVPSLSLVPRDEDSRHTDVVESLIAKYELDRGQAYKLQELADSKGIEWVLEKDALTQSKSNLKSTSGFFIKACALDWKPAKPSQPAQRKRKSPTPQPELPILTDDQRLDRASQLRDLRKELAQA